MNQENIIRDEAQEFYDGSLLSNPHVESSEKLQILRIKLLDFYSPEYKAIFLDELETTTRTRLLEHQKAQHHGIPNKDCYFDIGAEKLLFYLRQELENLPKIIKHRATQNDGKSRSKVFVSYSHVDSNYLCDIQRHFKPFLKNINYWDDSKIAPGQKWKDEIKKALNETKVAIMLVSTDFLGSEFIMNEELPSLLKSAEEEGAAILIVILKPCLFEDFSELNIYQAMNKPSLPVSKMDENEREELYVNLVRQTQKILNENK